MEEQKTSENLSFHNNNRDIGPKKSKKKTFKVKFLKILESMQKFAMIWEVFSKKRKKIYWIL